MKNKKKIKGKNNKIKKKTVDTRLFIIKNIFKTLKYYIRNILYILFINFAIFGLISLFFKDKYDYIIYKISPNTTVYNMLYYSIFILFFYTSKIIFYVNVVYTSRNLGRNDLMDLTSIVLKRFLPTLGTSILYLASVLFLSCFFVIPGIMFAFYFFFAPYLSSIGDLNEDNKILNSGKALSRSYSLVKGNLIRFMILTSIISSIIIVVELLMVFIFKQTRIPLNQFILNAIKLSSIDLIAIYGALIFHKFNKIENDFLEAKGFKQDKEEELLMNEAAANYFK